MILAAGLAKNGAGAGAGLGVAGWAGRGWGGGGGAVISNYFVVLGWVRLEIDGLGGSTLAMTSNFYLFLS